MNINIALLGLKDSAKKDAGHKIKSLLQNQVNKISVFYFPESKSLMADILNFDIVAVSNEMFKMELPRLQQAIIEKSKAKEKGKKIILTNLKYPLEESTIQNWIERLELNETVITIPLQNGIKDERAKDIVYFEYSNRKVYIKTSNHYYETNLKMKEVREKVRNLNYFETPYVSYVVNLFWVESIKSRDILMKNGDLIPLSQKKAHYFRKAFKTFLSLLH